MRRSYTRRELLKWGNPRGKSESCWVFGHICERAVAIALACKAGSLVVPEPPDDRIFISWHKLHKHLASAGHVEHSSRTTTKQTNPTTQPKAAKRKKESKPPERRR